MSEYSYLLLKNAVAKFELNLGKRIVLLAYLQSPIVLHVDRKVGNQPQQIPLELRIIGYQTLNSQTAMLPYLRLQLISHLILIKVRIRKILAISSQQIKQQMNLVFLIRKTSAIMTALFYVN